MCLQRHSGQDWEHILCWTFHKNADIQRNHLLTTVLSFKAIIPSVGSTHKQIASEACWRWTAQPKSVALIFALTQHSMKKDVSVFVLNPVKRADLHIVKAWRPMPPTRIIRKIYSGPNSCSYPTQLNNTTIQLYHTIIQYLWRMSI